RAFYYPTLRKKREGWGTRFCCGAKKTQVSPLGSPATADRPGMKISSFPLKPNDGFHPSEQKSLAGDPDSRKEQEADPSASLKMTSARVGHSLAAPKRHFSHSGVSREEVLPAAAPELSLRQPPSIMWERQPISTTCCILHSPAIHG
ncbi:MAG: hypothetical protein ACLQGT_11370, partial [Terracidiphilus sp.]